MRKLLLFILVVSILLTGCNSAANTGDKEPENVERKAPEGTKKKTVTTSKAVDVKKVSHKMPEALSKTTPFDYLSKVVVDEEDGILVKYNPASTEVYNKKVSDLDPNDPFYPDEEDPGMGNVKLIKTQIKPGGSYYYVVFSWGPSADPAFIFYKQGATDKMVFSLSGERLFIPGNGNIYIDGHTNNLFNTRKKLKLVNDELVEIKQPFYYVGLKSQTMKSAKLYESEHLRNVIANLPEGYSVEVLINKPGTDLFLVRTDFGLTGWLKLGQNAFWGNEVIKGLYFAGD